MAGLGFVYLLNGISTSYGLFNSEIYFIWDPRRYYPSGFERTCDLWQWQSTLGFIELQNRMLFSVTYQDTHLEWVGSYSSPKYSMSRQPSDYNNDPAECLLHTKECTFFSLKK